MFQQLIVNRAVASVELFAKCVRQELDRAGTAPEVRQQIAVLFDNALICYGAAKRGDSNTEAVLNAIRPKMRQWLF